MIRIVSFLGVFFFLQLAQADSGFFTLDGLRQANRPEPQQLENALRSSFRIVIGHGMTTNCSAQFISNDGYVLTALHCMDPTIETANTFRMVSVKSGNATWVEVGNQVPLHSTAVHVRAYIPGWGYYNGPAQTVFLGRGYAGNFPEYQPHTGWDSPVEARQAVALNSEDFLILKLDLRNRPVSCVTVASDNIQSGAPVWAVGFPEAAYRGGHRSSNGNSRYITYGNVVSTYIENPAMRAQNLPVAVAQEMDRLYLPPARFISTADSWVGMSGAMILNQQGQIAGILARGGSSSRRYQTASTDAVRASFILEKVRTHFDESRVATIFSCQD